MKTEKSTYEYDKYLNSIGELSKMALDQEAAKLQTLQNTYDKAVSTLSTTQNKVQQDLKMLRIAINPLRQSTMTKANRFLWKSSSKI